MIPKTCKECGRLLGPPNGTVITITPRDGEKEYYCGPCGVDEVKKQDQGRE